MTVPPIPPVDLRFMGEDEEVFLDVGDRMVSELRDRAGLEADSHILDVGSGYGRLAHALRRHGFEGRYRGVDILERQIAWCREHLADPGGRYRFEMLDVRNDRYRPGGATEPADVDFPVADVDLVVFASVFTHMWPDEVAAYLEEAATVLADDGRVYASFFLLNDRWRRAAGAGATLWPLPHRHGSTSRYMDADEPLHVIAHDEDWVREQAREVGLKLARPVHYGAWTSQDDGGDPRPGGNHDWMTFAPAG